MSMFRRYFFICDMFEPICLFSLLSPGLFLQLYRGFYAAILSEAAIHPEDGLKLSVSQVVSADLCLQELVEMMLEKQTCDGYSVEKFRGNSVNSSNNVGKLNSVH